MTGRVKKKAEGRETKKKICEKKMRRKLESHKTSHCMNSIEKMGRGRWDSAVSSYGKIFTFPSLKKKSIEYQLFQVYWLHPTV